MEKLFIPCKRDSAFYRDLRYIADDETVIENPHKGWYYHFVDNGMRRSFYRDGVKEGYFFEDVPGLKIIYLRIDWSDIEKEEGVYDWSEIDEIMEKWGAHGFKFTFRICTFEGISRDIPFATPKYVFDKGAKYIAHDLRSINSKTPFDENEPYCYEPYYSDPVFLENLDRFMTECERKLDGHPLVEYIDVGSFGTWGEGHCCAGSELSYDLDTIKAHIDMCIRHFKKTQIMLNYGLAKDFEWLAHYGAEMGLGLRCDSINVAGYVASNGYNTLSTPDMYDLYNPYAPVDLEHGHLRCNTPDVHRSGLAYLEALKRSGATYAGFHGYIEQWLPENKYIHSYIANRLGYWYFLDGFSMSPVFSGRNAFLTLDVRNKGFAKAYYKYTAKALIKDNSGNLTEIKCSDIDNTAWLPEQECTSRISLDFENVKKGTYTLYFGLFDKDTPVKFAIKPEYYENGYCNFGKIVVE